METEDEFLRHCSDEMAGAALLGASLRWGLEGVLPNKEDLPDLAVRLQELLEAMATRIEKRRRHLRQSVS